MESNINDIHLLKIKGCYSIFNIFNINMTALEERAIGTNQVDEQKTNRWSRVKIAIQQD
jgi:hypothetical protein